MNRLRKVLLGIAIVTAVWVAAYWVQPGRTRFLPICLFHEFTGLNCPGCGATRALHELAHGHLMSAFHMNPLLLVVSPVFGILYVWRRELLRKPWLAWTLAGLVVAFGILRNVPVYPFTMLSP